MRRTTKRSDIPVGTQFSPDTIDLSALLSAIVKHSGDRNALGLAVTSPPVRIKPYNGAPTNRMRALPLEAAIQYGLIEKNTHEATDLARKLEPLTGLQLHEEFARHILLRLGGLRVVQGAEQMYLDGQRVTGDSLSRYLTTQGFLVTEHNTAINTLRMWLSRAGLFPVSGRGAHAWRPDPAAKQRLVGLSDETIAALTTFSPQQVAFTIALARSNPIVGQKLSAAEVRDLAEATFGVRVGRGSLPNEVLRPLADAGLITFTTSGTAGGKAATLEITPHFRSDVLLPFVEHTLNDLDVAVATYFSTRPADILGDLSSNDKYKAGKALEAYVVLLMRLLGLRFVGWRRRAQETGYGEVDVLMSGLIGSLPTTWQVQCKNTPSAAIRLEDVAREVGLLPLTKATHILVVANSNYTTDAHRYANEIMSTSPVTIFLLGAREFDTVLSRPESLGMVLRTQAEHIQKVKTRAPLWSGLSPAGRTDT